MKCFFLLFLAFCVVIPTAGRAEDEPFTPDDFGSTKDSNPSIGPAYDRRRNRRPKQPPPDTPTEVRESRDSSHDETRYDTREERPVRRRDDSAWNSRELPWWNARACRNGLGFEAHSPGSGSILGTGSLVYGGWLSDGFGVEMYLGVYKAAGEATTTSVTDTNAVAKTSSTTTTFSGRAKALNVTIGTYLKFRAYGNSWFTFHLGPTIAVSPSSTVSSQTGTRTQTFGNTDNLGNYTITDTNFGTVDESRSVLISVGPKLGGEIYLKWIPHLAIGLSTGILAVIGGNTTETTAILPSRTITATNGVEADPGTVPTKVTTVSTKRGVEGNTFGLGGTTFSFVGTFTLRYIW